MRSTKKETGRMMAEKCHRVKIKWHICVTFLEVGGMGVKFCSVIVYLE